MPIPIGCFVNKVMCATWTIVEDYTLNNSVIYIYIYIFKMEPYLLILFPVPVIFLYETGPMQSIFSQHCGYWRPGVLPPVRHYIRHSTKYAPMHFQLFNG